MDTLCTKFEDLKDCVTNVQKTLKMKEKVLYEKQEQIETLRAKEQENRAQRRKVMCSDNVTYVINEENVIDIFLFYP